MGWWFSQSPDTLTAQEESPDETLVVPISLHIVVEDSDYPDPELSSQRTEDGLRDILENSNLATELLFSVR